MVSPFLSFLGNKRWQGNPLSTRVHFADTMSTNKICSMCACAIDRSDNGGGHTLHFCSSVFCTFSFMCFTSPMFSQAKEAHRQADGLQSIAYCLNELQWGAHVGGGRCLLGAGLAALGACKCCPGHCPGLATQGPFLWPQVRPQWQIQEPFVAWGLPAATDPHTGEEQGQQKKMRS